MKSYQFQTAIEFVIIRDQRINNRSIDSIHSERRNEDWIVINTKGNICFHAYFLAWYLSHILIL